MIDLIKISVLNHGSVFQIDHVPFFQRTDGYDAIMALHDGTRVTIFKSSDKQTSLTKSFDQISIRLYRNRRCPFAWPSSFSFHLPASLDESSTLARNPFVFPSCVYWRSAIHFLSMHSVDSGHNGRLCTQTQLRTGELYSVSSSQHVEDKPMRKKRWDASTTIYIVYLVREPNRRYGHLVSPWMPHEHTYNTYIAVMSG